MSRFFSFVLFLTVLEGNSQSPLLQSGPMLGYSERREVMLWVQTTQTAKVKIVYWEKEGKGGLFSTQEIVTDKSTAFVAKLLADKVLPGKKYAYTLLINGKEIRRPYPLEFQSQELWQWRKPAPDFTFALGSCAFINDSLYDRPGTGYGGGEEIFTTIFKKKPDFMVWLGDNTYLREADWNSQAGIYYRHTISRSLPSLQPLLGSTHHYAIWDDHDYGPNDADRSFWNKHLTKRGFDLFWGNPPNFLSEKEGITCTFQWGDAQFFLLDDRWFRTPNTRKDVPRDYLGKTQLEWLLDALASSQATFKFICVGGQVLNPAALYENYSTYEEERAYLLTSIQKAKIKGVFFFTGDRHHSELTKLERTGTYPLYDLTVSPLTSGTHSTKEANYFRVDSTLVDAKNFGIVQVSGKDKERKLSITLYSTKGDEIWRKEIWAKELE